MVEYGLMAALVAVISGPAISMAGHRTEETFDVVGEALAAGAGTVSANGSGDQSGSGPDAGDGGSPVTTTTTVPAPTTTSTAPSGGFDDLDDDDDDDDELDEVEAPDVSHVSAGSGEATLDEWDEKKNGGSGEWSASFDFENDWVNTHYLTLLVVRTDHKGKTTTTVVEDFEVPPGESASYVADENDLRVNKNKTRGVTSVEVTIVSVSTTDGEGESVEMTPTTPIIRTVDAPTP